MTAAAFERTPIKRLADVWLGKMVQNEPSTPEDVAAPYLRAAHVQPNGRIVDAETKTMWFGLRELATHDLRPGDVVVVEGGAGFGRSAVIRSDFSSWGFQNSIIRLRPREGLSDPRFIDYALQASLADGLIDLACGTATIPHFTAEKAAAFRVPAPSVAVQRAIADFLDRETGQIDRLIAKQEQLIDTLRERRAAVADHAVTRGLDPLVAPKSTDLSWLGDVPAHWTVSRFGIEMAVNNGQVDPRQEPWADAVLVAPNHIESGTGRILGRETARQQAADSGKYVVSAGQIIYSKIRPALNKVAIATEDCICSADMYAISSRGQADTRYAAYFMRSTPFHQYASLTSDRVKMPKINRSELSGAPWLVPPIDEQRAIADYLDDQTAKIDVLIGQAERFIGLARERRAALVAAAVTGRIDVRGAV